MSYVGGIALAHVRDLLTFIVKVRIHERDCRAYSQADAPDVEQSVDSPVATKLPKIALINVLANTLHEGLSDSVFAFIPESTEGWDRRARRETVTGTEVLKQICKAVFAALSLVLCVVSN